MQRGGDDELLPAIAQIVAQAGAQPTDLTRVGVSIGPGGFTGVRIAVAATKMICEATGAECVGVPSAQVVARRVTRDGRPFAVALASKRDSVHLTIFNADGLASDAGAIRTAQDLGTLGIVRLIADQHLPPSFCELAVRHSIAIERPMFDPTACLETHPRGCRGGPDIPTSVLPARARGGDPLAGVAPRREVAPKDECSRTQVSSWRPLVTIVVWRTRAGWARGPPPYSRGFRLARRCSGAVVMAGEQNGQRDLAQKKVFTTGEAAQMCKVSQQTIIRCFDSGRLNGFRVPGSKFRRIPREELLRFMRQNGIPTETMEKSKRKILIVDDDPKIIELLEEVFRTDDRLEVSSASTGYDAGLLTERLKPDLIILDYMLPDVNGNIVCERIRSNADLIATKILLVSGVINQNEVQSLLNAGADAFVQKPFKIADLSERVHELLGVSA